MTAPTVTLSLNLGSVTTLTEESGPHMVAGWMRCTVYVVTEDSDGEEHVYTFVIKSKRPPDGVLLTVPVDGKMP